MTQAYYAHSVEGRPQRQWHRLEDHLQETAVLAAAFASAFDSADWGRLAGLWHDIGKYLPEFQAYLSRCATGETSPSGIDHSIIGACHAQSVVPEAAKARILAYVIAGHHAGLADWDGNGARSDLRPRMETAAAAALGNIPASVATTRTLPDPPLSFQDQRRAAAFQVAFFCRMLFSCLVDADYLSTGHFFRPESDGIRGTATLAIAELVERLATHLAAIEAKAKPSVVNASRRQVLDACMTAATQPPGLFSLTVPTGGGKTLSAMAFALGHAQQYGLRRVISVIPFTSIIEQNAAVYRRALGGENVIEHHSNLDPARESHTARLACENWDAPVIVTTNVQFFESLFSAKPSRCRKLHNIANSVIILDEAQTLPVTLLQPCLAALDELARNYRCSIVLCSATQPAVTSRQDFPIGLPGVREIIPDPKTLYAGLRRTQVTFAGALTDVQLAAAFAREEQVLCIVNTRRHAGSLYESLAGLAGVRHLSATMCPAHRSEVLAEIVSDLREGRPCRVVSTQLIEAGVDVDFPVVYRAMAGLDSVAQAAGRCNREGKQGSGQVTLFEPEAAIPPGHLRITADTTRELLTPQTDPLSLEVIEAYFQLHYWKRREDWDRKGILAHFDITAGKPVCAFRTVGEEFKLIEQTACPVIIPWGDKGKSLVRAVTGPVAPGRGAARTVQRLIVTIPEPQWSRLVDTGDIHVYHDRYPVLENPACYCQARGLCVERAGTWDQERYYAE